MQAEAGYFDGKTAERHSVRLFLEKGQLRLEGDGIGLTYPLDRIRLSDRVGSVGRSIMLPDEGLCETTDKAFLAELESRCVSSPVSAWVHKWERSLLLVVCGMLFMAAALGIFMRFGIPVLAKHVAFIVPAEVERKLGSDTLTTLDRFVFKPSTLDQQKKDELTRLFAGIADSPVYRIEFRSSPALGANALALPSGIVVITDGLVELAKNNDEIAAVLAHEVGHVRLRHGLRHVLQNSATALIMIAITGDMVSVTSLAATLPTALVDASFSRAFEREADDAAMEWMKKAGVDPRAYAEMLARLQAQLNVKSGGVEPGKKLRNYLSTHPDTGERIRRVLNQ